MSSTCVRKMVAALLTSVMTAWSLGAAQAVVFTEVDAQDQRKFVWPTSFVLAKASVDQLARSRGLSAARVTNTRSELARAEGLSGAARVTALQALGKKLAGDTAVNDMAATQR